MTGDLAHPSTYAVAVPHEEFARRRRTAAVSWVEEPDLEYHTTAGGVRVRVRHGSGFWAVTRYAEVVAVSKDPATFSSSERGAFLADPRGPGDLIRIRQLLVNMDAPEHTRIRRHATMALTPARVRRLTHQIHQHAAMLTDRVVAMGEFDAVRDLAAELPLLVLADLLGMPLADRALLFEWSNQLVGFDDPEYGGGDLDRYQAAFQTALGYARELAAERRRRPCDDLVTALLDSEVDGHHLSEDEFGQLWMLLIVAGHETTRHLLSGGLLALVEWPGELERLANGTVGQQTAVDEMLRWITPIMQFRRTALRDVDLEGRRIHAGDKVVVYYVSANRDESVFDRPSRFDLSRQPNPHLAFGVGPHFCLGARLAHLEARTLLEQLGPRLANLELSGVPVRLESNFVNGIKSLPMRLVS